MTAPECLPALSPRGSKPWNARPRARALFVLGGAAAGFGTMSLIALAAFGFAWPAQPAAFFGLCFASGGVAGAGAAWERLSRLPAPPADADAAWRVAFVRAVRDASRGDDPFRSLLLDALERGGGEILERAGLDGMSEERVRALGRDLAVLGEEELGRVARLLPARSLWSHHRLRVPMQKWARERLAGTGALVGRGGLGDDLDRIAAVADVAPLGWDAAPDAAADAIRVLAWADRFVGEMMQGRMEPEAAAESVARLRGMAEGAAQAMRVPIASPPAAPALPDLMEDAR